MVEMAENDRKCTLIQQGRKRQFILWNLTNKSMITHVEQNSPWFFFLIIWWEIVVSFQKQNNNVVSKNKSSWCVLHAEYPSILRNRDHRRWPVTSLKEISLAIFSPTSTKGLYVTCRLQKDCKCCLFSTSNPNHIDELKCSKWQLEI